MQEINDTIHGFNMHYMSLVRLTGPKRRSQAIPRKKLGQKGAKTGLPCRIKPA